MDPAMGFVVLNVDNAQVTDAQELLIAVQLARLVTRLAALVAFKNPVNFAISAMLVWLVILVDAIIIASQEVGMTLFVPAALEIITTLGMTVAHIRLASVSGWATVWNRDHVGW